MTVFVSPYTVTVTSIAGGLSHCSYVDGNGLPVPPGTVLTTSTPSGEAGSLEINFTEAVVDGKSLRLVGAAVKTVGNDPTMSTHNYLPASREPIGAGGAWVNGISVPWGVDAYTTRGVVLLFAQLNEAQDMVNFLPSTDPQTRNNGTS